MAERARSTQLATDERDVLIAACYVHDIGYATELQMSGFHPLDGALFLRKQGEERLAGLAAHHSFAAREAEIRGLTPDLARFDDEASQVSKLLTYLDLTTDAEGRTVTVEQRIADVHTRHEIDSPVCVALDSAAAEIEALAKSVEADGKLSTAA